MSHLLRGNQISFTRILKDRRSGKFLSGWNNAWWLDHHRLTVHQNNRITHRVVRSRGCFKILKNIIIQYLKSFELIRNYYLMNPLKFWKVSNYAMLDPTWMLVATMSLCDTIHSYFYSCPFLSPLFRKIHYRSTRHHRRHHRHPHRRHHLRHRRMIADAVPLADPIFVIFHITRIHRLL